jgi:quercetin dioxygenase-like cupin family protein
MTRAQSLDTKRLLIGAAGLLAIGLVAASPARAGTCPAGQTVADAGHAKMTEPKGVTDNVIGSIALGAEPVAIQGRDFRLRRLTIAPGGVVPFHAHADRPAIIYVVSGEVVEHASTCKTPIVHKAGDAVAEKHAVSHWWENKGTTPAVLLSADLLKTGDDPNMM